MTGRRRTDFLLDPRKVGRAIRTRRTDRGQRRADLPVAMSTLEQIEQGKALPSLDTAARLADHFHCSIDDLVGRSFPGRDGVPPGAVPAGPVRATTPGASGVVGTTSTGVSTRAARAS